MKTESKILGKEFEFSATPIGLFVDDNLWLHDKWVVIIEGQEFDYRTGIGHRIEKDSFSREKFIRLKNMNPKQTKENLKYYAEDFAKVSKVKPLEVDDVLYSLITDASAGSMIFEDFCDNFGYDNDSIKAEGVYRECQKTVNKIRKFIDDIEQAEELFCNY